MVAATVNFKSYNKAPYHGTGMGQPRVDGFRSSTDALDELGDIAKIYKFDNGHLVDVTLFLEPLAASGLTVSVKLTDDVTTYEIIVDSIVGVLGGCSRMDDTLVSARAREQVLSRGWYLFLEVTGAAVTPAVGLVGLQAQVHPDP